jgi:hypothetical protein
MSTRTLGHPPQSFVACGLVRRKIAAPNAFAAIEIARDPHFSGRQHFGPPTWSMLLHSRKPNMSDHNAWRHRDRLCAGSRDLRTRPRARAKPHVSADGDLDRHMRPSSQINERSDDRHSCRLRAGSAHARIRALDRPAVTRPILSRYAQIARSPRPIRLRLAATRSPQPLGSKLCAPSRVAKSHGVRGTAGTHRPRFRALTLFAHRWPFSDFLSQSLI